MTNQDTSHWSWNFVKGQKFIMPDPNGSFGDDWNHGDWVGTIVDFRLSYSKDVFAIIMDIDGNCFDIEISRLTNLKSAK